jgi:hypothetical protein
LRIGINLMKFATLFLSGAMVSSLIAAEPPTTNQPRPGKASTPDASATAAPALTPAELAAIRADGIQVFHPELKPKGLAGVGLKPEDVNRAIERGREYLWGHLKKGQP